MIGQFRLVRVPGGFFCSAPFTGTSGVLMRTGDGGVHTDIPGDQPLGVGTGLQPRQDLRPDPGALPPAKQSVDRLPGTTGGWDVSPRRAGPRPPADAVDELPSTPPRRATWLFPTGSSGSSTAHCASVRSARPAAATLATRFPVFSIFFVVDRSTGDLTYFTSDTPMKTHTTMSAGQHFETRPRRTISRMRWHRFLFERRNDGISVGVRNLDLESHE